jgi:hypothetical protein
VVHMCVCLVEGFQEDAIINLVEKYLLFWYVISIVGKIC